VRAPDDAAAHQRVLHEVNGLFFLIFPPHLPPEERNRSSQKPGPNTDMSARIYKYHLVTLKRFVNKIQFPAVFFSSKFGCQQLGYRARTLQGTSKNTRGRRVPLFHPRENITCGR
jgi:hypothetical protein